MRARDDPNTTMTLDQFNAFCGGLPSTSHVVQWGGAHVWKVGKGDKSKVFAIGWFEKGEPPAITFKVSDIGWEVLREAPGCRPAPYLASRGMKWIQVHERRAMKPTELKGYLRASHMMAAAGLPKRLRAELGLDQ